MAMDFGKLNFAVGFNRTSAFPLDANSYFETFAAAEAAAAGAAVVGSADSAYYIGQLLIVKDPTVGVGLYQINAGKTLTKFGQASSADELASKVSALETRCNVIEGKLILADASNNGLLSKEDFVKLTNIEENAQVNKIESVKVDGVALDIQEKAVNIDLSGIAKKSELEQVKATAEAAMPKAGGTFEGAIHVIAPTENTNPATKKYVDDALGNITGIKFEIVESLPETGVAGTIYLVAHTHGEKDIYDEYVWVTDKFEKIGNTDIDLSNYATHDEITTAIEALDVDAVTVGADETITSLKEVDGKIVIGAAQKIAITQNAVEGLPAALEGKQAANENLDKFNALTGTGLVKKTAEGYEVDTTAYITNAALVDYAKTTEVNSAITAARTELTTEIEKRQTAEQVNALIAGANIAGEKITGSVALADAVKGTLTVGDKTFDGSADVTVTAETIGALTAVPLATTEAVGGIQIGFAKEGNKLPVELLEGKAFVEIPAAITYTAGQGLTLSESNAFYIADKSIVGNYIADNTISSAKITDLNISKLQQESTDELILDGGSATL